MNCKTPCLFEHFADVQQNFRGAAPFCPPPSPLPIAEPPTALASLSTPSAGEAVIESGWMDRRPVLLHRPIITFNVAVKVFLATRKKTAPDERHTSNRADEVDFLCAAAAAEICLCHFYFCTHRHQCPPPSTHVTIEVHCNAGWILIVKRFTFFSSSFCSIGLTWPSSSWRPAGGADYQPANNFGPLTHLDLPAARLALPISQQ